MANRHKGKMATPTDFRASASAPAYHVKNKDEIARTLRERLAANNGLFSKKLQLALVVLLIASAVLRMWWIVAAIGAILLLDFAVFVARRRQTLRRWTEGVPRQTTARDFELADQSFAAVGQRSPTMSDFEQAMGFSEEPDWRTANRYREIVQFYCGGLVADIGCGDGRLCWRYNICPSENYYGIDAGGLVKVLEEKTSGRGHAIVGIAEATGLPDNFVDFVACTEVFEHLTSPGHALGEFARVLQPGGRIVIQSPSARRMRNLNPFHLVQVYLGRWFPQILLRAMVHENTFLGAYSYHWDFTHQDFEEYVRGLPLEIESMHTAMYRFNPNGSLLHRFGYHVARLPIINSLWWDMTVVLRKHSPGSLRSTGGD